MSLTPMQRINLNKLLKIEPNLSQNFVNALIIKSGIKSGSAYDLMGILSSSFGNIFTIDTANKIEIKIINSSDNLTRSCLIVFDWASLLIFAWKDF